MSDRDQVPADQVPADHEAVEVEAEVVTDYAKEGFSLTMRAPLPARDESLNPLA